jgi:hypothetical protein
VTTSSVVLYDDARRGVRWKYSQWCSVYNRHVLWPECTDPRDSGRMALGRKQTGTRTHVGPKALANRSPALFRHLATGGERWVLECLWRRGRFRASEPHRRYYRYACLGSRGKSESRWLPYLLRDQHGNVRPVLRERAGCGQHHCPCYEGPEPRDAILLRGNRL